MRPPYTCIYREIWNDEKFYSSSVSGMLVYFYILTCPLGNGLGCFKGGIAGMEEDSRINSKPFREGFREGLDKGLFEYDNSSRVILVPKYFERNPPSNPNGIKALSKEFVRIPNCELKLKCYHIVRGWVELKKESFAEPFKELFDEPIIEPLLEQPGTISSSCSPSCSPSPSCSSVDESQAIVPQKTRLPKKTKRKPSKGGPTWDSYSKAFELRYGTDCPRNAKANALCSQLVDRIGADESPHVAAFYVTSNNGYYVQRGHSLQCLVADAEKVRTEWATGNRITQSKAQEADRLSEQGNVWTRVKEKHGDQDGPKIN